MLSLSESTERKCQQYLTIQNHPYFVTSLALYVLAFLMSFDAHLVEFTSNLPGLPNPILLRTTNMLIVTWMVAILYWIVLSIRRQPNLWHYAVLPMCLLQLAFFAIGAIAALVYGIGLFMFKADWIGENFIFLGGTGVCFGTYLFGLLVYGIVSKCVERFCPREREESLSISSLTYVQV